MWGQGTERWLKGLSVLLRFLKNLSPPLLFPPHPFLRVINSNKYFTIIYRDLDKEERRKLLENPNVSASGYSHAFDDRDGLLNLLISLERSLPEIADYVGSWSHKDKLYEEITNIRKILKAHGRLPKTQLAVEKIQTKSNLSVSPPEELIGTLQAIAPIPGYGGCSAHEREVWLIQQAYSAGADTELAICLEWLNSYRWDLAETLREERRPKPPSLKKQALDTLNKLRTDGYPCNFQPDEDWDTLYRALESIPDDN